MLIVPAIDLIEGRCVRLFQGVYDQKMIYDQDPVTQARNYEEAGFRRLHVIDLEGARDGHGRNRQAIRRIVESVSVPVQVGGGIRTDSDVAELLSYRVAHLILGTVALERPELVERWIMRWGSERFLISIDLRGGALQSHGWLQESRVDLETMIERIRSWTIDEVICTDVERDGTLAQPRLETYQELAARLGDTVDLIAAGGISRPEDLAGLRKAGAAGAIVGRALYERRIPMQDWLDGGQGQQDAF
jgi:phosphoribosylformimino-5-aminoimidazole carboxamide ribotide isomerase